MASNEKPRSLSTLVVVVGSACNLRCTYCYNDTHESNVVARDRVGRVRKESRRWDAVRVEDAVTWAVAAGFSRIMLTGGEPFLYRHTWAWLYAAQQRGLPTTISTNLTLLAKPALDALLDLRNVTLSVGIGGVDELSHNRYRGGWNELVKNLHAAHSAELNMHLNLVLTRRLMTRIPEYEAFCATVGAIAHVSPLSTPDRGCVDKRDVLRLASRDEWDECLASATTPSLSREIAIARSYYLESASPRMCRVLGRDAVLLANGTLHGCFFRDDVLLGQFESLPADAMREVVTRAADKPLTCFGESCLSVFTY